MGLARTLPTFCKPRPGEKDEGERMGGKERKWVKICIVGLTEMDAARYVITNARDAKHTSLMVGLTRIIFVKIFADLKGSFVSLILSILI